jgi:hypothetical protein
MKPDAVRLIDVFALGPLMVWGGIQSAKSNRFLGVILAAGGALTIVYNGKNWLESQRRKQR